MIRKEDWLLKAKSLCIGSSTRVFHGREHRPNLVIGNDIDKWWCYCQACKHGGVQQKEHVMLGTSPETKRSDLTLPRDLVRCGIGLDPVLDHGVGQFLASKGMDYSMLPDLWYSCTRKRILIQTAEGWLGRDITGNALEKWLTYNKQQFLWKGRNSNTTVVVEDTFSFYKVLWAVEQVNVMCALGTACKNSMLVQLLDTRQSTVIFLFDGDPAGHHGADAGAHRVRGFGIQGFSQCAPGGKDPKDLQAHELQTLIYKVIQNEQPKS